VLLDRFDEVLAQLQRDSLFELKLLGQQHHDGLLLSQRQPGKDNGEERRKTRNRTHDDPNPDWP
jgi:hypothetical protein